MFEQFFAFGVRQLFGGARRGQPIITALGAAITIWGLFRRLDRRDKPIYTRKMRDGETIRIRMWRGETIVEPGDPV
jgi:hypothetical protein